MRVFFSDIWYLLRTAYGEFVRDAGSVTAGAIAFYSALALVPVVLLVLSLVGHLLGQSAQTTREAEAVLQQVLPAGAGRQVVEAVRSYSASRHLLVNVVGSLGLLWSGVNLFGVLSMILTTIWMGRPERGFFAQRLVGFLALLVAAVMFLANIAITSALAALRAHEEVGHVAEVLRVVGIALPFLVSALLAALTFFLLYRFLPGGRVSTRAALVAALPAAALWLLSRYVFSLLVAHSSRYGQLYGPLAGAVVLLLWIYYSAYILIFCGELGAAAQQRYWSGKGVRPAGMI